MFDLDLQALRTQRAFELVTEARQLMHATDSQGLSELAAETCDAIGRCLTGLEDPVLHKLLQKRARAVAKFRERQRLLRGTHAGLEHLAPDEPETDATLTSSAAIVKSKGVNRYSIAEDEGVVEGTRSSSSGGPTYISRNSVPNGSRPPATQPTTRFLEKKRREEEEQAAAERDDADDGTRGSLRSPSMRGEEFEDFSSISGVGAPSRSLRGSTGTLRPSDVAPTTTTTTRPFADSLLDRLSSSSIPNAPNFSIRVCVYEVYDETSVNLLVERGGGGQPLYEQPTPYTGGGGGANLSNEFMKRRTGEGSVFVGRSTENFLEGHDHEDNFLENASTARGGFIVRQHMVPSSSKNLQNKNNNNWNGLGRRTSTERTSSGQILGLVRRLLAKTINKRRSGTSKGHDGRKSAAAAAADEVDRAWGDDKIGTSTTLVNSPLRVRKVRRHRTEEDDPLEDVPAQAVSSNITPADPTSSTTVPPVSSDEATKSVSSPPVAYHSKTTSAPVKTTARTHAAVHIVAFKDKDGGSAATASTKQEVGQDEEQDEDHLSRKQEVKNNDARMSEDGSPSSTSKVAIEDAPAEDDAGAASPSSTAAGSPSSMKKKAFGRMRTSRQMTFMDDGQLGGVVLGGGSPEARDKHRRASDHVLSHGGGRDLNLFHQEAADDHHDTLNRVESDEEHGHHAADAIRLQKEGDKLFSAGGNSQNDSNKVSTISNAGGRKVSLESSSSVASSSTSSSALRKGGNNKNATTTGVHFGGASVKPVVVADQSTSRSSPKSPSGGGHAFTTILSHGSRRSQGGSPQLQRFMKKAATDEMDVKSQMSQMWHAARLSCAADALSRRSRKLNHRARAAQQQSLITAKRASTMSLKRASSRVSDEVQLGGRRSAVVARGAGVDGAANGLFGGGEQNSRTRSSGGDKDSINGSLGSRKRRSSAVSSNASSQRGKQEQDITHPGGTSRHSLDSLGDEEDDQDDDTMNDDDDAASTQDSQAGSPRTRGAAGGGGRRRRSRNSGGDIDVAGNATTSARSSSTAFFDEEDEDAVNDLSPSSAATQANRRDRDVFEEDDEAEDEGDDGPDSIAPKASSEYRRIKDALTFDVTTMRAHAERLQDALEEHDLFHNEEEDHHDDLHDEEELHRENRRIAPKPGGRTGRTSQISNPGSGAPLIPLGSAGKSSPTRPSAGGRSSILKIDTGDGTYDRSGNGGPGSSSSQTSKTGERGGSMMVGFHLEGDDVVPDRSSPTSKSNMTRPEGEAAARTSRNLEMFESEHDHHISTAHEHDSEHVHRTAGVDMLYTANYRSSVLQGGRMRSRSLGHGGKGRRAEEWRNVKLRRVLAKAASRMFERQPLTSGGVFAPFSSKLSLTTSMATSVMTSGTASIMNNSSLFPSRDVSTSGHLNTSGHQLQHQSASSNLLGSMPSSTSAAPGGSSGANGPLIPAVTTNAVNGMDHASSRRSKGSLNFANGGMPTAQEIALMVKQRAEQEDLADFALSTVFTRAPIIERDRLAFPIFMEGHYEDPHCDDVSQVAGVLVCQIVLPDDNDDEDLILQNIDEAGEPNGMDANGAPRDVRATTAEDHGDNSLSSTLERNLQANTTRNSVTTNRTSAAAAGLTSIAQDGGANSAMIINATNPRMTHHNYKSCVSSTNVGGGYGLTGYHAHDYSFYSASSKQGGVITTTGSGAPSTTHYLAHLDRRYSSSGGGRDSLASIRTSTSTKPEDPDLVTFPRDYVGAIHIVAGVLSDAWNYHTSKRIRNVLEGVTFSMVHAMEEVIEHEGKTFQNDILPVVCGVAKNLVGCDKVALWFVDGDGKELVLREQSGGVLLRGARVNLKAGLVGLCIHNRSVVNVTDGVEEHPRYNPYLDCGGELVRVGEEVFHRGKLLRNVLSVPLFGEHEKDSKDGGNETDAEEEAVLQDLDAQLSFMHRLATNDDLPGGEAIIEDGDEEDAGKLREGDAVRESRDSNASKRNKNAATPSQPTVTPPPSSATADSTSTSIMKDQEVPTRELPSALSRGSGKVERSGTRRGVTIRVPDRSGSAEDLSCTDHAGVDFDVEHIRASFNDVVAGRGTANLDGGGPGVAPGARMSIAARKKSIMWQQEGVALLEDVVLHHRKTGILDQVKAKQCLANMTLARSYCRDSAHRAAVSGIMTELQKSLAAESRKASIRVNKLKLLRSRGGNSETMMNKDLQVRDNLQSGRATVAEGAAFASSTSETESSKKGTGGEQPSSRGQEESTSGSASVSAATRGGSATPNNSSRLPLGRQELEERAKQNKNRSPESLSRGQSGEIDAPAAVVPKNSTLSVATVASCRFSETTGLYSEQVSTYGASASGVSVMEPLGDRISMIERYKSRLLDSLDSDLVEIAQHPEGIRRKKVIGVVQFGNYGLAETDGMFDYGQSVVQFACALAQGPIDLAVRIAGLLSKLNAERSQKNRVWSLAERMMRCQTIRDLVSLVSFQLKEIMHCDYAAILFHDSANRIVRTALTKRGHSRATASGSSATRSSTGTAEQQYNEDRTVFLSYGPGADMPGAGTAIEEAIMTGRPVIVNHLDPQMVEKLKPLYADRWEQAATSSSQTTMMGNSVQSGEARNVVVVPVFNRPQSLKSKTGSGHRGDHRGMDHGPENVTGLLWLFNKKDVSKTRLASWTREDAQTLRFLAVELMGHFSRLRSDLVMEEARLNLDSNTQSLLAQYYSMASTSTTAAGHHSHSVSVHTGGAPVVSPRITNLVVPGRDAASPAQKAAKPAEVEKPPASGDRRTVLPSQTSKETTPIPSSPETPVAEAAHAAHGHSSKMKAQTPSKETTDKRAIGVLHTGVTPPHGKTSLAVVPSASSAELIEPVTWDLCVLDLLGAEVQDGMVRRVLEHTGLIPLPENLLQAKNAAALQAQQGASGTGSGNNKGAGGSSGVPPQVLSSIDNLVGLASAPPQGSHPYLLTGMPVLHTSYVLKYCSLVRALYHSPDSVPYHNYFHALCVAQLAYLLLRDAKLLHEVRPIEFLAVILGSLGHDAGHRGFTNQFEVSTKSDLALRYNDLSVLENHHASISWGSIVSAGVALQVSMQDCLPAHTAEQDQSGSAGDQTATKPSNTAGASAGASSSGSTTSPASPASRVVPPKISPTLDRFRLLFVSGIINTDMKFHGEHIQKAHHVVKYCQDRDAKVGDEDIYAPDEDEDDDTTSSSSSGSEGSAVDVEELVERQLLTEAEDDDILDVELDEELDAAENEEGGGGASGSDDIRKRYSKRTSKSRDSRTSNGPRAVEMSPNLKPASEATASKESTAGPLHLPNVPGRGPCSQVDQDRASNASHETVDVEMSGEGDEEDDADGEGEDQDGNGNIKKSSNSGSKNYSGSGDKRATTSRASGRVSNTSGKRRLSGASATSSGAEASASTSSRNKTNKTKGTSPKSTSSKTKSGASPKRSKNDSKVVSRASSGGGKIKRSTKTPVKPPLEPLPDNVRQDVCELFLHLADIGNMVTPLKQSVRWKKIVLAEFESQAIAETKLGLPISMFPDGLDTPIKRARTQVGFLNYVVMPLFNVLHSQFPMPVPAGYAKVTSAFYTKIIKGEIELDEYPGDEVIRQLET